MSARVDPFHAAAAHSIATVPIQLHVHKLSGLFRFVFATVTLRVTPYTCVEQTASVPNTEEHKAAELLRVLTTHSVRSQQS